MFNNETFNTSVHHHLHRTLSTFYYQYNVVVKKNDMTYSGVVQSVPPRLLHNDICPQMGDTFFGQADVSGWGTRQVLGGHFAVLHCCTRLLLHNCEMFNLSNDFLLQHLVEG
jgi:hypothetical protein